VILALDRRGPAVAGPFHAMPRRRSCRLVTPDTRAESWNPTPSVSGVVESIKHQEECQTRTATFTVGRDMWGTYTPGPVPTRRPGLTQSPAVECLQDDEIVCGLFAVDADDGMAGGEERQALGPGVAATGDSVGDLPGGGRACPFPGP
jgi:hypothetical protein